MNNPEKLAKNGTQDKKKQKNNKQAKTKAQHNRVPCSLHAKDLFSRYGKKSRHIAASIKDYIFSTHPTLN
jgi:hypothetical protein